MSYLIQNKIIVIPATLTSSDNSVDVSMLVAKPAMRDHYCLQIRIEVRIYYRVFVVHNQRLSRVRVAPEISLVNIPNYVIVLKHIFEYNLFVRL